MRVAFLSRAALKLTLSLAVLLGSAVSAFAQSELAEPPTFRSERHVLDILMIAKPKRISLAGFTPEAWVYEVCYKHDAIGNSCPKNSKTAAGYGGMRLQLEPGDHLKIRFINQLPPAPPDAEHAHGDMGEMLVDNPSNLHTHGLIVEPRRATREDETYGDYVYVLAYPKGKLPAMQHPGLDYTDKPLDFDIYVPKDHPSGLFWIHPHAHGLALNQVSYGLAGIITIGGVEDYLSNSGRQNGFLNSHRIRYLTLKDMQVLPNGGVLSQEDPDFCVSDPQSDEPRRNGYCRGVRYTGDDEVHDYTGGKWVFSVNGQVFPTISVKKNTGEVWRITNASGSRSYELALANDADDKALQFQVLSVDGVSIDSSAAEETMAARLKGKIVPEKCAHASGPAVCASSVRMMPSSRVELWVASAHGEHVKSATLLTRSYETGPDGDDWPESGLAHVVFASGGAGSGGQGGFSANTVAVAPNARTLAEGGALSGEVKISGGKHPDEMTIRNAQQSVSSLPQDSSQSLAAHLASLSAAPEVESPACKALPAGHKRRIFFGTPQDNSDAFGLGYEEIDEGGNPVANTFRDIVEFDHSFITVCLPLAEGNKTAHEPWELVNIAGEDHNFHIHQTKFTVLKAGVGDSETGAMVDNVPVPHGSGTCDGSVASWRSGACQVEAVEVSIPFAEVGDFVYHCHILEHEDGGMMAHIRVVPHE